MIQPTTSFMFVENVKQVVKHALMILLALHLIIGHLGNLILILHTIWSSIRIKPRFQFEVFFSGMMKIIDFRTLIFENF